MSINMLHIKPLTSLRGIAAIYVFFHHLIGYNLKTVGDKVLEHTQLIANGYLWVDFFFILSGFLLALLYQQSFSEKKISPTTFWVKRIARIYPLHLFVLGLFVLVQLALYLKGNSQVFVDQFSIPDLIRSLLLVHAIQIHPSFTPWNGPSWSVSAEWVAYLLFPVIVLALYKLQENTHKLLFVVAALVGLYFVEGATNRQLDLTGYLGLMRCLLEFSLGIVLSNGLYNSEFSSRWLVNSFTQVALSALLIWTLHLDGYDVVSVALMALIIASVSGGSSAFNNLLSQPWLVYLGMISYSIYMIHWFVFSAVEKVASFVFGIKLKELTATMDLLFVSMICVLLVFVSSVFCFHVIEEPLRKWIPRKLGMGN